jgi:hypothetical protein
MKVWPFFILILLSASIKAQQQNKTEIDLETFAERLFPAQEEDMDYEELYENLFQLYQNPIHLNKADAEELQATYLFTPLQLKNFLEYRTRFGSFISLYELQSIPDFDLSTIENLIPFVTIGDNEVRTKKFFRRISEEENAYLTIRHRKTWEPRRGFLLDTVENKALYLGDPNEIYMRLRVQRPKDFSIGFTLDKDAGEQFKWDRKSARYGFNFASFHFTRYAAGKWKTISIGDFQASFGQGLVFGAGYSLGKGAETVPTVRRSSRGILPYSAAMEFGFFRGIGLTRQMGRWQSTLIFSSAPRDGRLNSAENSVENNNSYITSLLQTGLHRTSSELATKNQIREASLGGNLTYLSKTGKWSAGANLLFTEFSKPWIRDETIYNAFEFSGSKNRVASIFGTHNWKNFLFFGESAYSQSGGIGSVLGFASSLSKAFDFSFLWRNYGRDFHSFYSSGFSENTRPINEKGMYLGLQFKPSKIWKFNAYYDVFQFPWLKYRVYSPSKGYEWLARLSYKPSKTLTAFFQIREEQKERNMANTGESALPYLLVSIQKINATLGLETKISSKVFLRSRILWSQVKQPNEKINTGLMLLQDIQFGHEKWKITGRVAVFDTESYDNRLYAFENNVIWTFSIPAFAGRGIRAYLLGQYQITPRLNAYLRIARTTYTDREEISSGLQAIDGNKQTETTLLLRYFLG